MYTLVYHYRKTIGNEVIEWEFHSEKFRLRRNALHYLLEIVQSDYRKDGYGTEQIVGGINCYKSKKTDNGGRRIIEVTIKVEKA